MASTSEPRGLLTGDETLAVWRLDDARHAASWDSGEGAYRVGGRWNRPGMRAVYCSLDAATAILEVAVHKGFGVLARVPHMLSEIIVSRRHVHTVHIGSIPDADWLLPDVPTIEQQTYGDALLRAHCFVMIPSVVSPKSWNLMFDAGRAAGFYSLRSQEEFVLDRRLKR